MSPAPIADPCGSFGGAGKAAREAHEHDRAPSTPEIFCCYLFA